MSLTMTSNFWLSERYYCLGTTLDELHVPLVGVGAKHAAQAAQHPGLVIDKQDVTFLGHVGSFSSKTLVQRAWPTSSRHPCQATTAGWMIVLAAAIASPAAARAAAW